MAPAVRAVFVAGRLAQRRFAAELLGVPAGDLTASYRCPRCGPDAGHGRPGYTLAGVPAPLALSLSRAAGWTLLAAVTDPAPGFLLGVDVEDPARTGFAGFAGVALTAAEQRAVAPLPGARCGRPGPALGAQGSLVENDRRGAADVPGRTGRHRPAGPG